MFSIVVATDLNNGIGKNGRIPWKCAHDMAHFRRTTSQADDNIVIMGRATWDSLPRKPLPKRRNIIISSRAMPDLVPNCVHVFSPEEAVRVAAEYPAARAWIIGGASIYRWFLERELVHEIFQTCIRVDGECDRFFPEIDSRFIETENVNLCECASMRRFAWRNEEEQRLLDAINEILLRGAPSDDRTGTGTLRQFGRRFEFSLEKGAFPLMTSKPQPFRWIFEELMWILRGNTSVRDLQEKGVSVWDSNATADFVARQKLQIPLAAGELGPTYGFQMRHFGAQYPARAGGTDQLSGLIDSIRAEPESRRLILSLWNPQDLRKTALPPCLLFYQFYVEDGHLSCQFMNRSSDIAVAGGWNVCTAALLTIILAAATGLKPKRLVWITGDTHIYRNNLEAARELGARTPTLYPRLQLLRPLATLDDILSLDAADFWLFNYNPQRAPSLKFQIN